MVENLLGCLVLFLCGLLIGIVCLWLILTIIIFPFGPSLCGADDLGIGGGSYLGLLILYERWAGERLVIEGAVPFARRVGRPISVSAVPVGPGTDIWALLSLSWESCSLSCSVTWWVVSVFALSHWCKSLQTSAFGLGKVWARCYFSSPGNVGSRLFRCSA